MCASQSPFKKKKKGQAGNEPSNILPKSLITRKKPPYGYCNKVTDKVMAPRLLVSPVIAVLEVDWAEVV